VHLVATEWADGAWLVVLRTPDGTPVCFGPYEDPEMADERAEATRRFVAAVIRLASEAE
jgi:hypothetical protein